MSDPVPPDSDASLEPGQRGLHEIALAAGEHRKITVTGDPYLVLQLIQHGGDDPVYSATFRCDPRDPLADLTQPDGWLDLDLGGYRRTTDLWVVCASAAVISLERGTR